MFLTRHPDEHTERKDHLVIEELQTTISNFVCQESLGFFALLFIIPLSDMVHEGFQVRRDFEAAQFAQAFITNHHRWNSFIKNPIHERKNRQTQAVRPRNKNDSNEHHKTPERLIKIFLHIKLPALADGTAVENFLNSVEFSPFFRTLRTNDRLVFAQWCLRKFFAGITCASDRIHSHCPRCVIARSTF